MQKRNVKKLIILGMASGALFANQAANSAEKPDSSSKKSTSAVLAAENGNMGYHLMSEDELMVQLNDAGIKLYNSLSPEGKTLAREVASMHCNGTNPCKHLNACQTDKNACAGKGDCKHQSKCAVSDPNLAVKLAAEKMAEKRQKAQ